jgi:hypothetical protein
MSDKTRVRDVDKQHKYKTQSNLCLNGNYYYTSDCLGWIREL